MTVLWHIKPRSRQDAGKPLPREGAIRLGKALPYMKQTSCGLGDGWDTGRYRCLLSERQRDSLLTQTRIYEVDEVIDLYARRTFGYFKNLRDRNEDDQV